MYCAWCAVKTHSLHLNPYSPSSFLSTLMAAWLVVARSARSSHMGCPLARTAGATLPDARLRCRITPRTRRRGSIRTAAAASTGRMMACLLVSYRPLAHAGFPNAGALEAMACLLVS